MYPFVVMCFYTIHIYTVCCISDQACTYMCTFIVLQDHFTYLILSFALATSKKKLYHIYTTVSLLYGKYSILVAKYSMVGSPEVSRI